jgi:hypothetical protein
MDLLRFILGNPPVPAHYGIIDLAVHGTCELCRKAESSLESPGLLRSARGPQRALEAKRHRHRAVAARPFTTQVALIPVQQLRKPRSWRHDGSTAGRPSTAKQQPRRDLQAAAYSSIRNTESSSEGETTTVCQPATFGSRCRSRAVASSGSGPKVRRRGWGDRETGEQVIVQAQPKRQVAQAELLQEEVNSTENSCLALSPDAQKWPGCGGLGNVRCTNQSSPSGIFLWFGPLKRRQTATRALSAGSSVKALFPCGCGQKADSLLGVSRRDVCHDGWPTALSIFNRAGHGGDVMDARVVPLRSAWWKLPRDYISLLDWLR